MIKEDRERNLLVTPIITTTASPEIPTTGVIRTQNRSTATTAASMEKQDQKINLDRIRALVQAQATSAKTDRDLQAETMVNLESKTPVNSSDNWNKKKKGKGWTWIKSIGRQAYINGNEI
jgi:hypothetical protein